MADYLSFAGGIPILDSESSNSEQKLNVADLTLEEEPIVQFNNSILELKSLATAPLPIPEASRKHPRDIASDEKLIKGSGLFIKRPWIPRCLDTKKWILKNVSLTRLQNPNVQDQYAESMCLPSDVL